MAKTSSSDINYQEELTNKIRENYLSIALGFLIFLIAVTLIFRSTGGKNILSNSTNTPNAEESETTGEASGSEYVVKKGDTISKISLAQYGTMDYTDEIVALNKLKAPDAIEVGQKLKLPEGKKMETQGTVTTKPTQKNTMSGAPITGNTYVMQKGDTLFKVAERAYGDGSKWVDLVKANKLRNANWVEAGMKLTIPR